MRNGSAREGMTSPCCSAGGAATPTPPRRPRAARRTRSPTPGGVRAPGSRANTPISPPNAASLLLARCNLKHDVVEEADLSDERLAGYRALLVPNAGHLAGETIARIERWLGGADRRLIVTGKTNLPPHLLGPARLHAGARSPGYTGWRWRPGSPFAGAAWEKLYVSGYAGHPAQQRRAGAGQPRARRPRRAHGRSDERHHGDGRARWDRPSCSPTGRSTSPTRCFELIGGMLQAHLNVEAVRHWANPTHWGDTLLFFLRRLLLEVGLDGAVADAPALVRRLRRRAVVPPRRARHARLQLPRLSDPEPDPRQLRHRGPGLLDQHQRGDGRGMGGAHDAGTASSSRRCTTTARSATRRRRSTARGSYEHVRNAARNLGFPVYTCGRHAGGHMHPETIDAMDYLYAHDERILGLCTFCYYHMIEYGVRNPNVMVGGQIGGKPLTYVTDVRRTIATSGRLVSLPPRRHHRQRNGGRCAAGTARTSTMPPTSWSRRSSAATAAARRGVDDHLENGVYSFQYHPGAGPRPVRRTTARARSTTCATAINLAERKQLLDRDASASCTSAWPTTRTSSSRCATAAAR